MGIREKQGKHLEGSVKSLLRHDTVDSPLFHSSELSLRRKEHQMSECNPLPLPPKDKSVLSQTPRKRHTRIHPLIIQGSNLKRTMNRINAEISNENTVLSTVQNAHHYLNTEHFPKSSSSIAAVKKPIRNSIKKTEQTSHYQNVGIKLPVKDEDSFDRDSLKFEAQIEKSLTSKDCCDGINADFEYDVKRQNVPLSSENRKENLVDKNVIDLNCIANLEYIDGDDVLFTRYENGDNKAKLSTFSKNGLPLPPVGDFSKLKIKSDLNDQEIKDIGSSSSLDKVPSKEATEQVPPPKMRSKSVDDDEAYPVDSQKDSMLARNRVSVEDLLKFADQKPCGRQRGTESDEVRIMCKVLNHQVSAETCLTTLEFVSWNVHRAIKLAELRIAAGGELNECFAALNACSWDVSRAAQLLVGQCDITQV